MSTRLPDPIDLVEPVTLAARALVRADTCVIVVVVIGDLADVWQSVGVDVARCKADGEDGSGRMDGLGEDVGWEGEGADVIKHFLGRLELGLWVTDGLKRFATVR